MKYFTIGYGGRTPTEFTTLLQVHGIRIVADVRAVPEKAMLGSYMKAKSPDKGIEALLAGVGIAYASLKSLGNPFRSDADWKARYAELMRREGPALMQPLLDLEGPVCLLCAEKRVEQCHRECLAELLQQAGHTVEHIV